MAYVVTCSLALEKDGVQAICHMSLFPTINRILPLIRHDTAPVPIKMHLRRASGGSHLQNTPTTFHSYVMCGGNLDGALEKACNTIKHVLIALEKVLKAA